MSMNNALFGRVQLQSHSIRNLIQWGDHLCVDHPVIDAQHKALFEFGSTIYENWRSGGTIDGLRRAMENFAHLLKEHFSYEEQVLTEIGFAGLDEHAAEHRVMLREMALLKEEFERRQAVGSFSGGSLLAPGWPITQMILGFIIGHVTTSDMSYCRALAGSDDGAR